MYVIVEVTDYFILIVVNKILITLWINNIQKSLHAENL